MNAEIPFPVEASTHGRKPLPSRMRKHRWFALFVILPTLLSAIYYCFIAADIYVSESRFVVKSPNEKRPQLSSLANLIQTTGLSGGQEQANEILEFVRSRDALADLQRQLNVERRYASGDFLARFPRPFSDRAFEDLYKYYGSMVEANLDTQTGTAVLKVRAFTPNDAYTINRTLLQLSEAMVNQLNIRSQSRAISEAQNQVDIATARARTASVLLTRYRNSSSLIDPSKQAVGVLEISNALIAQRAALQAQLEAMQRQAPRNPSIPALRSKIAAISAQVAQQEGRVVGQGGGIASKLGGFEDLQVEQKFAIESLNVANAALVQARAEAQRQNFYLERVVDPNKPDSALLPNRLLNVIIVAAAALCLYLIGWMLIVGILEHAPED
jgi:capsular polysaccharide transport system permease protein